MLASTHLSPRLARLLWATSILRTRLETALDRADRYASPQVFLGAALGMADFGTAVVDRHQKVAERYQHALAEVAQAATRWTTRVSQLEFADYQDLQRLGLDIAATLALVDPATTQTRVGIAAQRDDAASDQAPREFACATGPTSASNKSPGPRIAYLRKQLESVESGLRNARPDCYR